MVKVSGATRPVTISGPTCAGADARSLCYRVAEGAPQRRRSASIKRNMAKVESLRIYIHTSVLGGCFDVEFAEWSNGLIGDFRSGRMVPVLSDMTVAEVVDAPPQVRELHQEMLVLAGSVLVITP